MGEAQPQTAVLQFLGNSATYGNHEVRRIDTHANVVFLAGDRALKVKRAVRLPFLDYSTLAKRKAACASELEVNRAFAPELYRRVVPITRNSDGQLALDGDGETIEWAVEMLRFDESQTLDRIADVRGIDDALARKLAETIVAMHARMPVVDANSWIAALERFLEQNAAAFREAPALFPADLAGKLDHAARSTFERLRPLLASRGRRGLVRRGHGDLHLGNIALLQERPVPFDAIEFDPDVAAGDVLYDLAFLLMDLQERRLGRAANIVFNGYFSRLHIGRGLGWPCGFAVLHVAARGDTRQGDCLAPAICRGQGPGDPQRSRESLFPARHGAAFAAAANLSGNWGIVGNRQVVARTRIGAACRARSGGSAAPLRRRAQTALWSCRD